MSRDRIHWSFWLIATVALVWNLLGCANFFSQISADSYASLPEPYRTVIEGRPVWATAAFAIAVFGGALGSILLLLRRWAAYYLFVLSLLGAIVTVVQFHSAAGLGAIGATIGSGLQLATSVFLIWYSRWASRKSWLRGTRSGNPA